LIHRAITKKGGKTTHKFFVIADCRGDGLEAVSAGSAPLTCRFRTTDMSAVNPSLEIFAQKFFLRKVELGEKKVEIEKNSF
jgi:hypothetical protein